MMDLYIYCFLFYFVRGDEVTVDENTNGDITVTCPNPHRHPYCQWQRELSQGQFVDLTDREKDKYKNRGSPTMTIETFTFTDRGSYRCKCYDRTKQYKYSLSMTIDIADTRTEKRLNCRSGTQFLWKRNGLNINDNIKYLNTASKVLTLLNVDWNDGGKYRCNYFTGVWQHVDFYLVVQGPPEVNINENYYISRVGDNMTISGKIRNAPSNSVMQWKMSLVSLYNSGRLTIGNISNPFLRIRNVQLNDAGNYTLLVRNRYGKNHDFTILKVLSASITGNHYLIKKANESITFHCKVTDGERIIWRKNGKQLNLEVTGVVNNPSLQLKKLNRLDKGNFTCETCLKRITARSRILQLDVRDIPFVFTSHEKVEVNGGLDIVLPCSHDSNPLPTKVYWTKNGVKITVLSSSKYNGSTLGFPSLNIYDTKEENSGSYVCSVSNSMGTGYSKPIHLLITDTPSSERKEYAYMTPLIISLSVIGVILVFCGLLVCFKRRRRHSRHYESPDFKQDEVHRYSTARTADEYDLPNIQTDDDDTVRTTGSLGDRNEPKETRSFTVHDFLQLFNDKDKYTRHVQLEFKNLTESYNSNQSGSEYYNTTASIRKQNNSTTNSTYLNTTLTISEKFMPYMSAVPQSNSIGQFWEFVSKNGVEHIILLTKENQQVTEFYPISDKPIEMKHLRLELDLSEKKNKNLFLFHLQLTNKEKQSSTIVKIYKTTNWKEVDRHLPLEVLAQLLDVTRLSKSKSSLIMTNDELDICMAGILKVCADVFRAIDDSTSFNIVQLATEARKQHSKLFREIIDYELCYLLTHHHLESNHVYDAID
ncbi:uncharacterized protein [Mytilus edulis]|uniref:uncharacterized protein n=1 Tax=Mytilus edulis TaxID=6550 RepID=UPI0039F05B4B